MPAQMSHVNTLLAFINNNKKGGILVFFLTRDFTEDRSSAQFKRRKSSLLSRYRHPPLKKKCKNQIKIFQEEEKSQAPRLLRRQRFTPFVVRSRNGGRDPESQLLWKPRGSAVISEASLHTHTSEHGHLDSLLPWREARLQRFHPCGSLQGRRKAPTRELATLHARCFVKKGDN